MRTDTRRTDTAATRLGQVVVVSKAGARRVAHRQSGHGDALQPSSTSIEGKPARQKFRLPLRDTMCARRRGDRAARRLAGGASQGLRSRRRAERWHAPAAVERRARAEGGRRGGDGGEGAPARFGGRRRRPPRHRTAEPRQGPKGLGQQGSLRRTLWLISLDVLVLSRTIPYLSGTGTVLRSI